MDSINCRICKKKIKTIFCDLNYSPLANSYLKKKDLEKKEIYHPLKVFFCKNCYLFQLPNHKNPNEIFKDYDYLSSYSKDWLLHCEKYVNKISKTLKLSSKSKICEIASNDGYLLYFFLKKNINTLGIEPSRIAAKIARERKIKTICKFFTTRLANKLKNNKFDLIICNNVLAHVPNILDFVNGLKLILSKNGTITFEFPHFLNLINKIQFDTIYHEHYSYLTIHALIKLFKKFKLSIYKIEKINTHGGSLRVYVKNNKNKKIKISNDVKKILNEENKSKIFSKEKFLWFNKKIERIRTNTINKLMKIKVNNKKIICYGAPAKGNTFINFCLISKNLLPVTFDKSIAKIGKYLPGSHIPIKNPDQIKKYKPDYVVILAWNLKDEIIKEFKKRNIQTKFITCIPKFKIII
jgi:2-polyprenyl-3-methyl-5-hydroxy-6-metoxy-1,4-benzoquinol methylase